MKKILSVIIALTVVLSLALCLASCGKNSGKADDTTAAEGASLSGLKFAEESDDTNTYTFGDGTYAEVYKNNTIEGTYTIEGDILTLTPNGAGYKYVFNIERDGDGVAKRLTQYEGRNFSLADTAAADTTAAPESRE